jgi:predicted dehydrogenase
VDSGQLGKVQHIEAALCVPMWKPGDIRYRWDLAGGAMMDLGAYTSNMVRYLAGAEPQVVAASAKCSQPNIDRAMKAELAFSDGRTGSMHCSLFSASVLRLSIRVDGDAGRLKAFNPIAPHIYHHLIVRTPDSKVRERLKGEATYTGQLRAFVAAIGSGTPPPTDGADGVANMALIDAVYACAGLPHRGT